MKAGKNENIKKRTVLWILLPVLLIICAAIFYQIAVSKTKRNEIEYDKLSYAVISYGNVYREVNDSRIKELALKMQAALRLGKADLEATNGEIELKNHRYVDGEGDDFTIELVLSEPQKWWVCSEEKGEKRSLDICGIFYSPNRDKAVIDFSSSAETVEKGEYSMEFAGLETDGEAWKICGMRSFG